MSPPGEPQEPVYEPDSLTGRLNVDQLERDMAACRYDLREHLIDRSDEYKAKVQPFFDDCLRAKGYKRAK